MGGGGGTAGTFLLTWGTGGFTNTNAENKYTHTLSLSLSRIRQLVNLKEKVEELSQNLADVVEALSGFEQAQVT